MAVIKDWIEAAAVEIRSSTGNIENTEINHIIEKHCPFKPDIAYMQVLHCETCAYYRSSPNIKGHCRYLSITVLPDFGCIRWEAKNG